MYAIYCQKTGDDIEDIIELFEEGHPFRLLFEIMDSSSFNEKVEAKLEQLRQLAPAEAKAIEAAKRAFTMDEATVAMNVFREAEDEGSELAVIFQAIYYDEAKDKTGQEEYLTRIAEKYPFFNQLLGDLYEKQYGVSDDFSYIQKAIECYYKADEFGMLLPKYANKLWSMYDYFEQKGLLEYDKQEIERLKILAKRVY
jgi:glutathione S-transferase